MCIRVYFECLINFFTLFPGLETIVRPFHILHCLLNIRKHAVKSELFQKCVHEFFSNNIMFIRTRSLSVQCILTVYSICPYKNNQ